MHAPIPVRLAALATGLVVGALGLAGGPAAASAAPYSQTDVMFLFDTSGSMGSVLEEAKSEIQQVMTRLSASLPSVEYGVAEVRDYPVSAYGEEGSGEMPWRLDTPVTTSSAAVTEAIEGLTATGGGDAPEAYGRGLWETSTNPDVGWRPGARHLIVLIADEVPHNPDVNDGIPSEFQLTEPGTDGVEAWPDTGEELPGTWGIPGTQLKEGEKLDFHAVLREMASNGTPLEIVDYHETGENFIHYWEYWAALGGGHALEAGTGEGEFAGKLTAIVETAPPPCAASAVPSLPSPGVLGGPPTAVTPRFGQPGSEITLTPASGTQFCAGQAPYLGASGPLQTEEATASKMRLHVPPQATSGLGMTNSSGVGLAPVGYAIDNFRYPWGFSVANTAGDGGLSPSEPGISTYDSKLKATRSDVEAVFSGLDAPGSDAYRTALRKAADTLKGGLCFGFSLLSWEAYLDAHGQKLPVNWASTPGFALKPGVMPYTLREEAGGSHGLTRALLRAAVSQNSTQDLKNETEVKGAGELEGMLNRAFAQGHPLLLSIFWKEAVNKPLLEFWKKSGYAIEGHTLLAYNYQANGDGLAVDVVDPNVPWTSARPGDDYENLQVQVGSDGKWSYSGTFEGVPFGSPISPTGTRQSVAMLAFTPAVPGKLSFQPLGGSGATVIEPAEDSEIAAISYSKDPGDGVPEDVTPVYSAFDGPIRSLQVPASHHAVTVTVASPSGAPTTTYANGPGFLDRVQLSAGENDMTVGSAGAAVTAPNAGPGTTLSVTRITDGVQRTATARFTGSVRRPRLVVTADGRVTLTTAGGKGSVALGTATYGPAGERATAKVARLRLHGRFHGATHTPKIKRHRRCRRHHRCERLGRSRRRR